MNFFKVSMFALTLSLSSFAMAGNTPSEDPFGFPEVICRTEAWSSTTNGFLYMFGNVGVMGTAPTNAKIAKALMGCLYFPTSEGCLNGSVAKQTNRLISTQRVVLFKKVESNDTQFFGQGKGLNSAGNKESRVDVQFGSLFGGPLSAIANVVTTSGEAKSYFYKCNKVKQDSLTNY